MNWFSLAIFIVVAGIAYGFGHNAGYSIAKTEDKKELLNFVKQKEKISDTIDKTDLAELCRIAGGKLRNNGTECF